MEAILNIGKSVMTNYNYVKRFGVIVIMAAVTAILITNVQRSVDYEMAQGLTVGGYIAETVMNSVLTVEQLSVLTGENEEGINTVATKVNRKAHSSVKKHTSESTAVNGALAQTVTVTIYGNGGVPELVTETFELDMFDLSKVNAPERLGKIFIGWFEDAACTIPFTGIAEAGEVSIYAGWSEIPGYLCNDQGYIWGTNGLDLQDGLAVLPSEKSCIGIKAGAFSGVEDEIFEIYIPSNITHIDKDAFENLPYLMYIEVANDNPAYYGNDGILYRLNGNVAFVPRMRR